MRAPGGNARRYAQRYAVDEHAAVLDPALHGGARLRPSRFFHQRHDQLVEPVARVGAASDEDHRRERLRHGAKGLRSAALVVGVAVFVFFGFVVQLGILSQI